MADEKVMERETSTTGVIDVNQSSLDSFVEKQISSEYHNVPTQIDAVADCGASQLRYSNLEKGGGINVKNIHTSGSDFAVLDLDTDTSIHRTTSNTLADNAEYIIEELPESPFIEKTMFPRPVHIIKDGLMAQLGGTPHRMTNMVDKNTDQGFYVNLLTCLTNLALKSKSTIVGVRVGITLPPKEVLTSPEHQRTIIEKIAGIYSITMPRFKYKVRLEIKPEDVSLHAEGETASIFYATASPEARLNFSDSKEHKTVIQDLGQTTFNIALIENGKILSGASYTAKKGGGTLESMLFKVLSQDGHLVGMKQAKEAVRTGYYMRGSQVVPVARELYKVKEKFAKELANEYETFLQANQLNPSEIHTILFAGRGMMQTGKIVATEEGNVGNEFFTPSIGYFLTEIYQRASEGTKCVVLPNTGFANLLGLSILKTVEWGLNK